MIANAGISAKDEVFAYDGTLPDPNDRANITNGRSFR